MACPGTPCAARSSANWASAPGRTATIARPADSLNSQVNGSPGSRTWQPDRPRRQDSASAMARPPSDRSCAADSRPSAAAATSRPARARSAARSDAGGRPPRCPCRTCAHADPPNSARSGRAARARGPRRWGSRSRAAGARRRGRRGPRSTGVGWIGDVAGLVVEADVAAGDRDAEGGAAVGEAADRLGELPHYRRVLGRAEVQAVRHGQRPRAGRRHIAVRLGQRELGSRVGVERGSSGRCRRWPGRCRARSPRRPGPGRRPPAWPAPCRRGRTGRTAR